MHARIEKRARSTDERSYLLPQGSGDGESPEELRALEVYELRMANFDALLETLGRGPRRRKPVGSFVRKNCEEAQGGKRW